MKTVFESDLPRRILITGATDGLGLALARKYDQFGHEVLATGRKPLARPEDLFGSKTITYMRADQTDPYKASIRIAQAMETLRWQSVDLVIINAGMGWAGDPMAEPASAIDEQIAVNLRAPIQIIHMLGPRLMAAKGQLTLIGSVAHKGSAGFATYAATKAGLHGLARSLREEWKGKVRVQMLHPGAIRTSMHGKAGFKTGAMRIAFTSVNRAANAIMRAIESGVETTRIKRRTILRTGWRVPKTVRRTKDLL